MAMAFVTAGLAIYGAMSAEDEKGGGGGGGAFIERPPTHSEMLRDIAQAAPIGQTGQEGTIQGSRKSAQQLKSHENFENYQKLFLAAAQRAGESASDETKRHMLAQALQMMPSQASDSSSPTTVQNRPRTVRV